MNKIISCVASFFVLPFFLLGQTASEAYRFSISDPTGTARNLGAGNSMFAVGPDFSSISLNPSGLGGYGKSEFLVTAGVGLNNYSASFTNDNFDETKSNFSNFNVSNLGFIIHSNPQSGKWVSSNWAIGFNRVAEYQRELQYSGNTLGSITDAWRENAAGTEPDDLNGFEEGLAYTSGAIYDFEDDNIYETDYNLNNQYALFKQESSIQSGGKTELFLAYGADLDHKLFVGFSIGLPIINFTESRKYAEDDDEDGIPFFNELEFNKSLVTTGYGLNAKVGVTLKPTSFLNIAFAFHSPTRFLLNDDFNTTLSYDFTDENNNGAITSESPYGSFQYVLRTPWSASAGIGIIAGKSGFLAVHAKFTDYGSMKYRYDVRGNGDRYDQIEREVNQDILTNYGSALQLNMGGEIVIANNYRLRGGLTMQQSPYNNDNSFDPSFHGGVGYRGENFYVDLGYKLTNEDEGYLPYETNDAPQPLVVIDKIQHQIAATVGFKF